MRSETKKDYRARERERRGEGIGEKVRMRVEEHKKPDRGGREWGLREEMGE